MNFDEFLKEWKNDKEYILALSSGSTGKPKNILLPKSFVKKSAGRTNDFFQLSPGSILHSCVGADFIGGKMMAVRAELINARFSYENPSNQPLKDLSSDLTLDLVAVVPSQVSYIIQNIGNLPKIKNLLIGGSAIHPELRKKIVNSGLNAYESYGMTETASHIALRKIEAFEKPFSVFPDISLSLDEDNCLVIHFEEGIIIKTNDIAEMVSETEFYIKGRRDQIIISGGRKINPMELEKIFSEFIHVSFLLTGFPDEKWGEKLVLIIEGEKNETLVSQLRDKLTHKCRKWEIPKEIIFVDSLPRTPNGKIKRIKDPSFLSFSAHDKDLSF